MKSFFFELVIFKLENRRISLSGMFYLELWKSEITVFYFFLVDHSNFKTWRVLLSGVLFT